MQPDYIGQVRAALTGLTGVLPRRAVLLDDGTLGEKMHNPALPEIVSVSLACEVLRRARQEPVHPRHTGQLLQHCVETNDPGAWRAFLDDAATGDIDEATAAAFWAGDGVMPRLVHCLVHVSSGCHLWLVVRVMQLVLRHVPKEAVQALGLAIQLSFGEILRTLSRRAGDISADMRGGVISTLGKLMVWCQIPVPALASMLETAVGQAPVDVLLLFTFAPIRSLVDHAPALVDSILQRAERTGQASRYAPCALLAVMSPHQLRPFQDRVLALVHATLDTAVAQQSVESKLALVCAVLAKTAAPPRSLQATLAHALSCLAFREVQQPAKGL